MSSTKKPEGRPSKYKPEYCDLLIEHGKEGFSFKSFAGKIGVDYDTIKEWCKVHSEFSAAKKNFQCVVQFALEKEGKDLTKGNYGKSANVAAWIFRMRNICGWRDDVQQDADDTDDWEIE